MKISSNLHGLRGTITVPGDKSISHRSIMLSSIAKGISYIEGFLPGADCISTISCFQKMGVEILQNKDKVKVKGLGLHSLQFPKDILDCGNSGTTIRLLSGILSGQNFSSILTGDNSIKKRPMKRIIEPLTSMGANIIGNHNNHAPLEIQPAYLHGIHYISRIASGQVKSSILFAGLYADGITSFTEPARSRNHTEIMLANFGVDISINGLTTSIIRPKEIFSRDIQIPSDISSAAFFMVAALVVPNSEILLKNVGINPTRAGILEVIQKMGGNIEIIPKNSKSEKTDQNLSIEPVADILVRSSKLHGIEIGGEIIPTLIDEIPIITALSCFAEGKTIIKDAAELKVKESNRIQAMVKGLSKMGGKITETKDGMIIEGGYPLYGTTIQSFKDHRIAMTFAILSLCCEGEMKIIDGDCVNISYPNFYKDLQTLI